MGAPMPDMEPVENASAEALLSSLKTIDPAERRKHASVFNYWLSIRGDRQFPPIRDLDPIEVSDAGPWSVLLEMIGGGEDAIIRHYGQAIRGGVEVEKICDAPTQSLLSRIHGKLPIVAACREAFAFEDEFASENGPARCWVTLLPFSASGSWIDFVYGYVSLDQAEAAEAAPEPAADTTGTEAVELTPEPEQAAENVQVADEPAEDPEPYKVELRPFDEEPETTEAAPAPVEMAPEPEAEPDSVAELEPEPEALVGSATESEPEGESEPASSGKAGFSAKFLEGLASSFYGKVTQSPPGPATDAAAEPDTEAAPDAKGEAFAEPACEVEGTLQSKLSDVRVLAEEAREAQVRSNIALYEGLSAAYDFALDAETEPEEYLRLVEALGLKIQLRSPMKPVVKLAFDGMCDEPTIGQLEAVLAWALKHDLPRGSLRERIEAEGGIGQILNGKAA